MIYNFLDRDIVITVIPNNVRVILEIYWKSLVASQASRCKYWKKSVAYMEERKNVGRGEFWDLRAPRNFSGFWSRLIRGFSELPRSTPPLFKILKNADGGPSHKSDGILSRGSGIMRILDISTDFRETNMSHISEFPNKTYSTISIC